MKIIKTTLVALTLVIGISSYAQENSTIQQKKPAQKEFRNTRNLNTIEFKLSPEQTANKRTDELNSKVKLTEDQLTKVKDLFLKVENQKETLKNSDASETEKNNALIELQKMEDDGLQSILTPDQNKILSAPKTNKTATNM